MSLSVAVALLCRSNAIALLAAACALIALDLLRHARWRDPHARAVALAAVATMTAGAALNWGRNVWYWLHGKVASWLVCNLGGVDADLQVPLELRNYVPMDIAVFLSNPWMSSRDDATGRRNVWNYLLRSSLSGEFPFDGALQRAIAIVWGVALLWLVLLVLLRLYRTRPSVGAWWREAPWAVLGLSWLGSIVSARVVYAFCCQADFRYVLPALVPFLVVCARGGRLPQALLSIIALGSAVFFLGL